MVVTLNSRLKEAFSGRIPCKDDDLKNKQRHQPQQPTRPLGDGAIVASSRRCTELMKCVFWKSKSKAQLFQTKRAVIPSGHNVITGRAVLSLMWRDTWPPAPPSQTTLIWLYQMGMTSPPTPLSRPCHRNCRDKAAGVGGAGWSTHRVRGHGGENRGGARLWPPLFISIRRLLFLAPCFVNDGNV